MRILVVEDGADLATALKLGLSAEGYDVDVCLDGLTGLQFARHGDYDAILLDLLLPLMSGYRFLDELRASNVWTPVLVLTASTGDTDLGDALDGGADDVVTKPFSFPLLLARLRALIRRAGTADTELVVGDLHVDRLRRRVRRGPAPIELSDREYKLVEELASRPAEPISKADLLARVWPDGADDHNLVEARILALRRKIDSPFGARSVQTVRGVGYRIVDDRADRADRA